jgi:hypothetical protein
MALPTLDSVFASAADLPRRQMLAKWLVEETETGGNSSVAVSGAGSDAANGTYTYRGDYEGKGYYNLVGQPDSTEASVVIWIGDRWLIIDAFSEPYESLEDVEFPWLVETWLVASGESPIPTVTEIPPQSPTIADYWTLPERYLWAKIAVAAGAPKDEAAYIGLPKQYAWKDIYNAVSGSSLGTIDWTEKQALGHIAAAYRGDTANPEALATYIDWPWRYQVASIITQLASEEEPVPNGNGGPTTFNAVIVSGAGSTEANGTYSETGEYEGKKYYNLQGSDPFTSSVMWDSAVWNIFDEFSGAMYTSSEDVEFPWLVETWIVFDFGQSPTPTLTPTNV